MPKFTIEATYHLPMFRQRTYEAETFELACQMALNDEDWEGQQDDPETAGETYLTGAWEGEDTAYKGTAIPIPVEPAGDEVKTERERIAAALDYEVSVTPCSEDASVVRDCARLVRADFSYEDAERLEDAEGSAA